MTTPGGNGLAGIPDAEASLGAMLDRERERVDRALGGILDGAGSGPLQAAARYAVEGGGKRLRPILCVAAYRALSGVGDGVPPAAYRVAASIELIHTYSLIHDDLPSMDDDAVRRGRPATHVAHGETTATLAGAALIPLAAGVVVEGGRSLGLNEEAVGALAGTLFRAAGAGGMVGGQALDLAAEGQPVSLEELAGIHRLKTGALLAASPVMGGIAAGADARARDALGVYGTALGLAFQIADDILDVTGETAVLGKKAGRDQELKKATFPSLAGLEGAEERASAEVGRALNALEAGGIRSRELTALARFAAARDR